MVSDSDPLELGGPSNMGWRGDSVSFPGAVFGRDIKIGGSAQDTASTCSSAWPTTMSVSLRAWTELHSVAITATSIARSDERGDSVFSTSGAELLATVVTSAPTGFKFREVIEALSVTLNWVVSMVRSGSEMTTLLDLLRDGIRPLSFGNCSRGDCQFQCMLCLRDRWLPVLGELDV